MSLFDKINKNKQGKNRRLINKTVERKSKVRVDAKNVSGIEKNKKSIEIYLRESKLPQLEIDSLDYSVFTKETLNSIAVCEITNINKSRDLTNTTDDPRLGTIDNNLLCATCEKTTDECPGHLGIITLPEEVIHPFFRLSAIKVLQSVCNTCKKLLLSEKHIIESGIIQSTGYTRLTKISEICSADKIRCTEGCPNNPIFKPQKSGENKTVDMYCLKKVGKEERPYFYSVAKIKEIFCNISEKDVQLMGFINNHPKNFIVNFVPVIPLSARPYVFRDGNVKQEDYLTTIYSEIVSKKIEYYQNGCDVVDPKTNKVDINATEEQRKEECIKKIIFFIEHSIKNCDKVYKRSPSGDCKSINDRISGKEAIIRGHMMGKRADYTGRSVLGPNRSISFGQIGMPIEMSGRLTVPERITKYNLDYINLLSDLGRIDYLCPNKGPFAGRKLKFDKNKHNFNIGDKVGRFSENGDIIIFNRQPTLHRQSFLGYVCNFQNKYSIGIHLSSTKGHNADFDGDEGNIHMLQTIDAQVEARLMMFSGANVMNYDFSGVEAGLVMNSLIGGYTLSRDDLIFTEEEFNQGIQSILRFSQTDYSETNLKTLNERLEYFEMEKYSGKSLISVLFPKDFVYTYKEDNGSSVRIRKGILIEGILKKQHLGGTAGSIIQSLWKQYGRVTTMNFISDSNFLFTWYSMKFGLTVSSKDVQVEKFKEFKEYKYGIIDTLNKEVESLPDLMADVTDLEKEEREVRVVTMIKQKSEEINKEFFGTSDQPGYLDKTNSLYIMLNSKAKGDEMQIGASSAFLGQQYPGGGRAKKIISGGKRWLPTFHIEDKSIYSRGFAKNSYFEGLNPDELFAQSQAARINMTDTALKTATTGHLQRKMMKAQENLVVRYDGTVRNHNNIIIQFNYGAGFNSSQMVYSYNNAGMKCRSFINLKEEIEKENTENDFNDYNISNYIVRFFNSINEKYGDEKLIEENEDFVKINNMDDYQEIQTFQNDEDFENSISMEMD